MTDLLVVEDDSQLRKALALAWRSRGYVVTTAAGPRVLLVGPDLLPQEVEDGPFDLMILSPRNPEALVIGKRAAPGLIVVDDTLLCQSRPDVAPPVVRRYSGTRLKASRMTSIRRLSSSEQSNGVNSHLWGLTTMESARSQPLNGARRSGMSATTPA